MIIRAETTRKTTENGGRKSGFTSTFKPKQVFKLPDDLIHLRTYISDILFDYKKLF